MFKVQGKAITNNNKQLTVNKQSSKKKPRNQNSEAICINEANYLLPIIYYL